MRGTERRADREARGGTGTGRRSAARGQGGARRWWGRGWRSAAVGERVARGHGGTRAAGGREARVQEGRGRAQGVIAGGCIQCRECTQVYFSAAVYIYIYIFRSGSQAKRRSNKPLFLRWDEHL
jgi:hypothetical protein